MAALTQAEIRRTRSMAKIMAALASLLFLCGAAYSLQISAHPSFHGKTVATILQSGSTNARAYRVTIYGDGSASAAMNSAADAARSSPAQPQNFPPGTVDVARLQSLLAAIGDVSTLPTGRCAKSASFGTETRIVYEDKTSGDLQCIRGTAGGEPASRMRAAEQLSDFIREMLRSLNINTRRVVHR
jgi:hypothetical protein